MGISLYRKKGWSAGIFIFLISAFVSIAIIWKIEDTRFQQKRAITKEVAIAKANQFEKTIERRLALTYPFAAMIQQMGSVPNFKLICEELIVNYPLISEIALAPNGVISQVAPLSGNEKAIGFNLLTDPIQKNEALLALKTRKITLAGPLNLVQGGKGLVGRLPVYTGEEKKFWGFVIIVIRFPEILEFTVLNKEGYDYVLTRIHPQTRLPQVIAQSKTGTLDQPIETTIHVPNAQWKLAITPTNGWYNKWIISIEAALGIFISLLFGYIAKQYTELKSYRHYLEQRVKERTFEIAKTKNELHTLLNTIPDLIWLKDINGVYLLCNPMFERFFGAKEDEIVGKSDYDFVNAELADFFREKDRLAMEKNGLSINEEWVTFADDGHRALLETIKTPMRDETGTLLGILGIARDITVHYNHEMRNQQLSNLYGALSHCNKTIVRAETPEELFIEVCKGIVSDNGIVMAWIALIDSSGEYVRVAASYGDTHHYLEGIEISILADIPSGKGPTGTAIRENRPYWCQDFLNDPVTEPWHERGANAGWKGSAALPIHLNGKVIGAFTVYADKPDAFDQSSQELLTEMAMDISFAMENFDRETKRKKANADLLKTEKLLEEMSSAAHIGGWKINLKNGLGIWTKEASLIYDLEPSDEVTLATGLSIFHGPWREKAQTALDTIIRDGVSRELELQMTTQKGNQKWVRMIASAIRESGEITQIQGSVQDITAQKLAEEKVQWLAHYDSLTELPNRTLLNDRVKYAISIAYRAQEPVALLFLDLDHFKNINDSLGHSIGDDLLIQVSKRIQSIVRDEDTLSRQGGDEFVILLPGTDADGAAHVAEKIIDVISEPYYIQQHELTITPSIGIALYPIDGKNAELLFQSADAAMYRAKHDGRNCYRFVTPEIQARSTRNLELENALRNAVKRDELELYYQPQISIETGGIVGAEALLRWNHPIFGMISPVEFIPIAEESGQIVTIGEWVLRRALGQLKSWISEGIEPFLMAVNLSAIQFRHPQLVSLILSILDELQLPTHYLELELTEGIAMENPLHAIELMKELDSHGIRMSIDDFGTGYSSLNYLKKFRVYKLKIDQSFIHDITENSEDKSIVQTIINMANSLNMITIAEGVETAEQLSLLRENGCKEVQGYYFSKPLPAQEFKAYVLNPTLP
ncbi:EAL domain-containing protein [Sulfuricurvum sp.]|uniref:bifunctional diguanylate cyclase/phosphodiesterase n=1 Tax=Sulfuricurvum sp. TaxID=2025608 RepID=UPI00261643B7|nr:EAL domain-containing protein [Sulfuricurvum sp.]MDD2266918.1 EAL domain-containing protein [Sulfuricurvum sp.]MDD2783636.1 EAL domain-containing protein [Sulfuricurvum sp.]